MVYIFPNEIRVFVWLLFANLANRDGQRVYSAGSATAACFVMMSCTSPGLNATSQAQRPKPPAALIAFTHSFSASRFALF
jgi:hypothetical protein